MDELPWPSFLLCLIVYLVSGHLGVQGLRIYAYVTALILLFCIWRWCTRMEWKIIWTRPAMYRESDPADTVCKYDHGRCNHSLSDDWTRAWRSV